MMTEEQAINIIKTEQTSVNRNDGINCDRCCENCDLVLPIGEIKEAYNMAISALKKQTPKKPLLACGHNVELMRQTFPMMYYCPICGQRIDWSEKEGE